MTATNPFRITLKNRPMASAVERILGLHHLAACYDSRPANANTEEFLDFALDYMGIHLHTPGGEQSLDQIPRSGPLLIVANHPLGGLEGIAITKLLMTISPRHQGAYQRTADPHTGVSGHFRRRECALCQRRQREPARSA